MSDQTRLALVMGVLLGVPLIVILLVSLTGDGTTIRRESRPPPAAAADPTPSPSVTPAPRPSPLAVSVDPTELPALTDDCDDESVLDGEARRQAFQDGLAAERTGVPPSESTRDWLGTLDEELGRCVDSLTADRSSLRQAMERLRAATGDYRNALGAPREHSVNRAWSELDGALEEVIERWSDTA